MTASKVLMIEPSLVSGIVSNPQTAGDNFFQQPVSSTAGEELAMKAKKEFDGLVEILVDAGIEVHVFKQNDSLETPDAIFPNNWFSTLPGSIMVLYPMMAANRRLERRPDIISFLGRNYSRKIDLTHDENRGIFLEGTGSLVIDHSNKIAYASLSQRTSSNLVYEWSKLTGYESVMFSAYDKNAKVIYHTNVMMCVGERFAIVCMEAIADQDGRERVKKSLMDTGHEVVEITMDQMHHFCGNCLELENNKGEKFLLMSSNAFHHFSEDQKTRIQKYCTILHSGLDIIETFGGGGARCMTAELF